MTLAENEHDQNGPAVKPAPLSLQAPVEIDESTLAQIQDALSVPYKLSADSICLLYTSPSPRDRG